MAVESIHVNAVAPYAMEVTVPGGSAGTFALDAVTAATLRVIRSDGTESTWACSITEQSVSSITLVHSFASGDVPIVADIRFVPTLATPAGNLYGAADLLRVTAYPT